MLGARKLAGNPSRAVVKRTSFAVAPKQGAAVVLAGQRLADGDEAGAHVGEVGDDVAAGAERAGEDDRLVGDLADLVEEGEGVRVPQWPPAPPQTAIRPSVPASSAFSCDNTRNIGAAMSGMRTRSPKVRSRVMPVYGQERPASALRLLRRAPENPCWYRRSSRLRIDRGDDMVVRQRVVSEPPREPARDVVPAPEPVAAARVGGGSGQAARPPRPGDERPDALASASQGGGARRAQPSSGHQRGALSSPSAGATQLLDRA